MLPERALVEALSRNGRTISIAESCTGGLMASRLTGVPGASAVLISAVVPYANDAKTALVGVPQELMIEHGSVSSEVAAAMASGIREVSGSDIGLSTTCIAGPGGGTPEKPVGLSYLAVADADGVEVKCSRLSGSRAWVREQLLENSFFAVLEHLDVSKPFPSGASLIIVADEVLQGHTVDTNSGEMASTLFEAGVPLARTVTVSDDLGDISEALNEAARASRLIVVSGGLGPTPDDRTIEALAHFLGVPLEENAVALAMVERRLSEGHAAGVVGDPSMNDDRRKMAILPRGGTPLDNDVGYGPGCLVETAGRTVVLLPGVPSEMRHMLRYVTQMAGENAGNNAPQHVEEVFHDGSESAIAPLMASLSLEFPLVSIGSYPDLEEYGSTIRFTGPEAPTREAAARLRDELGLRKCPPY